MSELPPDPFESPTDSEEVLSQEIWGLAQTLDAELHERIHEAHDPNEILSVRWLRRKVPYQYRLEYRDSWPNRRLQMTFIQPHPFEKGQSTAERFDLTERDGTSHASYYGGCRVVDGIHGDDAALIFRGALQTLVTYVSLYPPHVQKRILGNES